MKKLYRCLLAAPLALLLAEAAQAIPITYEYDAFIVATAPELGGTFSLHGIFTGTFSYETDAPALPGSDADFATFDALLGWSVRSADYSVSRARPDGGFEPMSLRADPLLVHLRAAANADIGEFFGPPLVGYGLRSWSIQLRSNASPPIDSLPDPLGEAGFRLGLVDLRFDSLTGGVPRLLVTAGVTELRRIEPTPVSVPEPSSLALLLVAALPIPFCRARRARTVHSR